MFSILAPYAYRRTGGLEIIISKVLLHRQVLVGVTFEAVFVGCPPGFRRASPDLVGLVAFCTRRHLVGFFFPKSVIDDLHVDLFNPAVTLHTCRCDVLPVDAALGVIVVENEVGGVARCTDSRNGQALFEEPPTMNRHREILKDVILRDIPLLHHLRTLLVAPPAEHRDVDDGCRRLRVGTSFDVMVLVACHARGGKRITLDSCPAVKALSMLIGLIFVAGSTTFQLRDRLNRGMHVVTLVAVRTMDILLSGGSPLPVGAILDFP